MKDQIEERGSFFYFDLASAVQKICFIYLLSFIHPSRIHCTDSQYDQHPVGLIAQLVEQWTGIAEVMRSNRVKA